MKVQTLRRARQCCASALFAFLVLLCTNSALAVVLPASGETYQVESDLADARPDPLAFTRTYRSNAPLTDGRLGGGWTHNHFAVLRHTPGSGRQIGADSAPVFFPASVHIVTAERTRSFAQDEDHLPWIDPSSRDTLNRLPDGGWSYKRGDDDATLRFNALGKLQSTTRRNGWTTTYTYNAAGQLASITNAFGRTLTLAYDAAGLLARITAPDGRSIGYSHDGNGNLTTVTSSDGKTRSYFYENAAFPSALTGIADETGTRYASFGYDSAGRAITTEHAGGTQRYQVSYPANDAASVTDPLGTVRNYSYSTTMGKLAVTKGSLPSGTGDSDAAARVQDSNGLITSETDFKGVRTDTTWDGWRRLPISVTRAAGTPEAQTVTTQWHASFSLPVLITESGRTIAFTYDSLGNLLSQSITDTATNTTQRWQWSYNPQGLVATQTAPNGGITRYTYDASGQVTEALDALGFSTKYTHDSAGRIASVTAPNGLLTTYAWDARDRLVSLTRSVGIAAPQTTTLRYHPNGTLDSITLPHGLVITYLHDDAHRFTGWTDNRGNRHAFTLDAMGNRVAERLTDTTGALVWTTGRSVNAINRVASNTQGSNQTRTFGHDANGELISETNGLNQSTRYGLDSLRRVHAVTDAANATALLDYNALDDLTQAKDFKGVATRYTRDALGNATLEASPDIGSLRISYDALGLPASIVDALGQATAITRDLLARPIRLAHADGKVTTLEYDLSPTSRGYLSRITDRSGVTEYQRDGFGRVTLKRQALASGLVHQVAYSYTHAGQLASIGHPDGSILGFVYDATGQLVQLNDNGTPAVTNITWNALGQPLRWNWPFVPGGNSAGLGVWRSYDTAGRLTATETNTYGYDGAGRMAFISQQLFKPASTNPAHTSITGYVATWLPAYDAAGRITRFDAGGGATDSATYGYDANGNRTTSSVRIGASTTNRAYTIDGASNRVLGFNQSIGAANTSVGYGYNANGELTSDGLRTFSYNAEGRLSAVTTGATDASPTTRYAHNALGQRVFKTEPLYPPAQGDEANPGFMQTLLNFFAQLWQPATSAAEKQGTAYVYDENGSLIYEAGTGGANSIGSTRHIYLPTANGPMPIVAVVNGKRFAVSSDHLNTPRRITNDQGQVVWQWAYSAFGETKPTTAHNRFADPSITPNAGTTNIAEFIYNKRWEGQYEDAESGLRYNVMRSYKTDGGVFTQNDPIGLAGGFNRRVTDANSPLNFSDPYGLYESPPLLRALVPGQAAYDIGRTALENGNYGAAAVSFAAMLGEQVVTAVTFAVSQGARAVASTAESCVAANGAREIAKTEVFAARTAPELKQIYGWGNGEAGVKAAMEALDAMAMARIQGGVTKAEVEAARNLYKEAAAAGRGGVVAPARAAYMENILKLWKSE